MIHKGFRPNICIRNSRLVTLNPVADTLRFFFFFH
jgi:hypothetical protein